MIKLQPFTLMDLPLLLDWIDSPAALLQWAGDRFEYPLTEDQLLQDFTSPATQTPGRLRFKAVRPQDNRMTGFLELQRLDTTREARLGLVIVGPLQLHGRGIGTQMVQQALEIAFRQLGFARVSLRVLVFNLGAIACFRKAGFRETGLIERHCRIGERYWSSLEMCADSRFPPEKKHASEM